MNAQKWPLSTDYNGDEGAPYSEVDTDDLNAVRELYEVCKAVDDFNKIPRAHCLPKELLDWEKRALAACRKREKEA